MTIDYWVILPLSTCLSTRMTNSVLLSCSSITKLRWFFDCQNVCLFSLSQFSLWVSLFLSVFLETQQKCKQSLYVGVRSVQRWHEHWDSTVKMCRSCRSRVVRSWQLRIRGPPFDSRLETNRHPRRMVWSPPPSPSPIVAKRGAALELGDSRAASRTLQVTGRCGRTTGSHTV